MVTCMYWLVFIFELRTKAVVRRMLDAGFIANLSTNSWWCRVRTLNSTRRLVANQAFSFDAAVLN